MDQNVEFFTDILSQFLKFGMLTLGRTRRGRGDVRVTVKVGAIPPSSPIRFFYLAFSVAVHLSLAHIAMVTSHDVISSKWSSQFWVKIYVF